jgi:hypothetical protein
MKITISDELVRFVAAVLIAAAASMVIRDVLALLSSFGII